MRSDTPAPRGAGEDFLGGLLLFLCVASPYVIYLAHALGV